MGFCEELIAENMENWLSAADLPFLDGIVRGTLDKEKFARYLVQDTQYLADFAKVYAHCFLKTDDLDLLKEIYGLMGMIVAGETEDHVRYLQGAGFDPAAIMAEQTEKACADYTEYMLKSAAEGTFAEAVFTSGPCNFSYYWLGLELERRMKALGNYETNYYRHWLDYYTGGEYKAGCDQYAALCNRAAQGIGREEKERCREIFRRCSDYEKEFWAMAWGN